MIEVCKEQVAVIQSFEEDLIKYLYTFFDLQEQTQTALPLLLVSASFVKDIEEYLLCWQISSTFVLIVCLHVQNALRP